MAGGSGPGRACAENQAAVRYADGLGGAARSARECSSDERIRKLVRPLGANWNPSSRQIIEFVRHAVTGKATKPSIWPPPASRVRGAEDYAVTVTPKSGTAIHYTVNVVDCG